MNAINPMFQLISTIVENASTAVFMDLPTGEMLDAGYEDFQMYACGDIVVHAGDLWKVWGFTVDSNVILRPYGLRTTDIHSMVVRPEGIRHPRYEDREVIQHKEGLVTFEL